MYRQTHFRYKKARLDACKGIAGPIKKMVSAHPFGCTYFGVAITFRHLLTRQIEQQAMTRGDTHCFVDVFDMAGCGLSGNA